jgi:hypothetical protein
LHHDHVCQMECLKNLRNGFLLVIKGPKFIDELDSYCHLFKGYHEAPISKDLPGSWSIHAIPLQRDVIVRSLLWPGYFMYYSDTGKDYGSGYFGMGEKNKDIAFCVP